ncbi:MAG: hypothetical protein GX548_01680 [Lentisphaerae bacterium]|nr:hypothetical protein [Lentisphaerota bacterium]
MKDVVNCIEHLRLQLERHRNKGLKELPTRTIFIDPMLLALGWDVRDPDEVGLEHTTVDGKSVDYALKLNRKPVLHVEAKPLNDPLEDIKAITQIVNYANGDGVEWCVLTNGIRYRIYKVSEKAMAPDKILFDVSLDPKDAPGVPVEALASSLSRISRDSMAEGHLDRFGAEMFANGKVRKALDQLFAEAPPALIRLIRTTIPDPSVAPAQIQQALRRIWPGGVAPDPVAPRPGRRQASPSAASRPRMPPGYTESHHTAGIPTEIVEIYRSLDSICRNMAPGQVVQRFCKMYVGWNIGDTVFCSAHLYKGYLRIWLKVDPRSLDPALTFARDVTRIGHWGNGNTELSISTLEQLGLSEPLIRKSFENSRKKA